MIIAVLDTNVLASGALRLGSTSSATGAVVRAWLDGRFRLASSTYVLHELRAVMVRPYFRDRITDADLALFIGWIAESAFITDELPSVSGIAPHPADDPIVATAIGCRADYLVTGDRELRAVGQHQGVRFVTAREFLDILDTAPVTVPEP